MSMEEAQRARTTAKVVASLFRLEGAAIVPLKPSPALGPIEWVVEIEGEPGGVEKWVKKILWENRSLPFVVDGTGVVGAVRDGKRAIVALGKTGGGS